MYEVNDAIVVGEWYLGILVFWMCRIIWRFCVVFV